MLIFCDLGGFLVFIFCVSNVFLDMSTGVSILCFCVNILCSWWLFLVFIFCVLNVFLDMSTGVCICDLGSYL